MEPKRKSGHFKRMTSTKLDRLFREIVHANLCEGCGACAYFCPDNCIRINFQAKSGLFNAELSKRNPGGCSDCGTCLQVCPALTKKYSKPRLPGTHEIDQVFDWFIEPHKHVYLGYASDRQRRYQCASGGLATSILTELVVSKQVDGIVMISPDPNQPIRHRIDLVQAPNNILNNRGSVYCHVDFSGVWPLIERHEGKLALMGLPCQLSAVKQVMRVRNLDAARLFKIGLFCGGTSSNKAMDYLCRRKNIDPDLVTAIRYRSGGWPGRKITAWVAKENDGGNDQPVVLLDRSASILQSGLYSFCFSGSHYPDFCKVCADQTATSADISLGDAWLPEISSNDNLGTNIIISRTDRGEKLLKEMHAAGIVEIQEATVAAVIRSQGDSLVGRKLGRWGRHIRKRSELDKEAAFFKDIIPQHFPGTWKCIERRMLQKLAEIKYQGFAFFCFMVYRVGVTLMMRAVHTALKSVTKGRT